MKVIPFNILEANQSYSGYGEDLSVNQKEKTVEIKITRQFGTPGHSVKVDEIVQEENSEYVINLSIEPPRPDAILLQVLTYYSLVIEIDKKDLASASTYKFRVKDNMKRSFMRMSDNIKRY